MIDIQCGAVFFCWLYTLGIKSVLFKNVLGKIASPKNSQKVPPLISFISTWQFLWILANSYNHSHSQWICFWVSVIFGFNKSNLLNYADRLWEHGIHRQEFWPFSIFYPLGRFSKSFKAIYTKFRKLDNLITLHAIFFVSESFR